MKLTNGFFPLDSIQFALVVWAFDGLPLVLGVTGFFMQLLLKYRILDTPSGGYLACNNFIRPALSLHHPLDSVACQVMLAITY